MLNKGCEGLGILHTIGIMSGCRAEFPQGLREIYTTGKQEESSYLLIC